MDLFENLTDDQIAERMLTDFGLMADVKETFLDCGFSSWKEIDEFCVKRWNRHVDEVRDIMRAKSFAQHRQMLANQARLGINKVASEIFYKEIIGAGRQKQAESMKVNIVFGDVPEEDEEEEDLK